MLPLHENTHYLDLLEKVLIYDFWKESNLDWYGNPVGVVPNSFRETGQAAWPGMAFTMIGRARMRNIRDLIARAVAENVPGDFAECGVWRGGACIYARACLPMDRKVWVCDSFAGFPKDEPETHWTTYTVLEVPQTEVMENFAKFGLSHNIDYIGGYFQDSLVRINQPLCVLRIDADSHRSTLQCLKHLWPKLSTGGYLICDDYKVLDPVRNAFIEYFGVEPPHTDIDQSGIWFKKEI